MCYNNYVIKLEKLMALNPAKILVIDDEVALLHSIIAYLEDSGFIAFGAENGKQGLEIFAAKQPDLVLTDLHMPILGGIEVLSTITKGTSEVPVIVISGAGELNDAIEALRLGAWDYLTKPISDLQVLEHAVNKALERKRLIAENKMYAQRIEQSLKILEEDQAAGRRVQMSLLPQDQLSVKDYVFKYKIIPSLELSGDFVEYFAITDDIYGVYLADVSGHGASSAFITVLLKSLVSQYQAHYRVSKNETIMSPAQMMQVLSNEIFAAKLSKYLTIIYGVINISTNEFSYGIGGHYPSPILLTTDGKASYLPGSGFPVGIIGTAEYQTQKVTLPKGGQIAMFTDGIMELLLPGESLDQKDQVLLDIVRNCKGDISAILDSCGYIATPKQSQPDDITILVLSHN
jgi:sigma-B regulation protein RsbU (phosphoserine phosphatase)